MPKDNRHSLPTNSATPTSPYSDVHLRRSNRLRQNTSGSSVAGPSNPPASYPSAAPSTPSQPRVEWQQLPTPSTPSNSRVVRTYSGASRKKDGKRRREASIDSVVSASSTQSDELPTPLAFLEQLRRGPVPSPSNPAQDAIIFQELLTSVESNGTCSICMQPMSRPYITSCGHGWCAGCLKSTFQAQLKSKLSRFSAIDHDHLNHMPFECQYIPASDFDRQLLVRALKDHRCNIEKIFIYSCPECRAPITTEPVVNYPLLHMLETQRKSLKGRIQRADASPYAPLYPFQGLFMN